MTDLEILDKWFLKNENCTYKEFCNIYNDGKELKGNLPFINFPQKILQIINDHPDGILQSAVKKMAGNFDGKNPKTIERYIEQLVKEELIIKEYNNNRGCSQQITLKINIEKESEIKNLLHISDFIK